MDNHMEEGKFSIKLRFWQEGERKRCWLGTTGICFATSDLVLTNLCRKYDAAEMWLQLSSCWKLFQALRLVHKTVCDQASTSFSSFCSCHVHVLATPQLPLVRHISCFWRNLLSSTCDSIILKFLYSYGSLLLELLPFPSFKGHHSDSPLNFSTQATSSLCRPLGRVDHSSFILCALYKILTLPPSHIVVLLSYVSLFPNQTVILYSSLHSHYLAVLGTMGGRRHLIDVWWMIECLRV